MKRSILPVLCWLLPWLSLAQLPGKTLVAAQAALDASRPSQSQAILQQLPEDQWRLVHHELELCVLYRMEAYDELLERAERLEQRYQLGPSAQLLVIKSAIQMGDIRKALARLEKIVSQIDPEQDQLVRGLIHWHNESYAEAGQHFEAAIAINARMAEAWSMRGRYLEHHDYLDLAKKAYQRSIALESREVAAHQGLARVCLRQQDVAGALAAYLEGIRQNPEAQTLMLEGANLALDIGDYPLARNLATQAVALFPELAEAHSQMGMSYVNEQSYTDAQAYLKRATQLRSIGSDHYFLGLAAIRTRQMELAHRHLEMALSLGFDRSDLPQLIEHCRSILASFDTEDHITPQ